MPTASRFVPVGVAAPDFALPSVTGGEVRLSQFRGRRYVVLVFLRGLG
jgi:peroxiredoxin